MILRVLRVRAATVEGETIRDERFPSAASNGYWRLDSGTDSGS
jgi:hypothetical protein